MKKRIFASVLVAFMGGLLAAACDDGGGDYDVVTVGGDRYCRRHTTCGECTPVAGCGWCQTGVGKGMCASDPDECAGNTVFSWTWDPSGCVESTPPPPVDAAAGTVDASESATADAGSPIAVDAGAPVAEDAEAPPP